MSADKADVAVSSPLSISIAGMNCGSCVGRIEAALAKIPGIERVSVNLLLKRADIWLKPQQVIDASQLLQAIEQAGYRPEVADIELAIAGMNCGSCVGRIESALAKVPGVVSVKVNLLTGLTYVTGLASVETLQQAVSAAGYSAKLLEPQASEKPLEAKPEADKPPSELWIALVLTLPILLLDMGSHLSPALAQWLALHLGETLNSYLQAGLTTLVLLWPGREFYRKGLAALWRLAPDMNSLVAVGTLAAYGYSLLVTLAPQLLPAASRHLYYEPAAVIVLLMLLGRYLEARAKGRASAAIARLLGLQPNLAQVWRDEQWQDLPVAQVELGDCVQLRPGERVAVDGEVLDGQSYVDESMLSGEAVPILKTAGSRLVAGSLNQQGALRFQATAVGRQTVLAQIIAMVEQAQAAKLPIQAIVDKLSAVFVPIVMLLSLLTFGLWLAFGPSLSLALINAVAVLIIACPCAMGLATPTSILVATGRGAELGILLRRGDALQQLQQVRAIAVDKTGTLTEGRPVLTDFIPAAGFDEHQLLAWVASAESSSQHPWASALLRKASEQQIPLATASQFESVTGMGVRAYVQGHRIEIGADRFMQSQTLDLSQFAEQAHRLALAGKSVFYAAVDGQLAAIMAVADPIKATSAAAIAALQQQGLRLVILTGDNRLTAQAIASQLAVQDYRAELMPADKVTAIQQLQARYGPVAFIGDGINDAPALAAADVGLAIGTGTDVAIESADLVLMSGNLQTAVQALALSKATMANIHQNLFWAFGYNLLLIPVAAGVLYPVTGILLSPVLAGSAMALSSLLVLANALRLKHLKL